MPVGLGEGGKESNQVPLHTKSKSTSAGVLSVMSSSAAASSGCCCRPYARRL